MAPQASPTINTISNSVTTVTVGSIVQLGNIDAGGELTYLWEFLDKPAGSLAAMSNAAIAAPTFTADCEGSYLIRLTVNRATATEDVATVVAAVKQLKLNERVPAAGETTQVSSLRGWAASVNDLLKKVDNSLAISGRMVVQAGSTVSRGDVVYVSGVATLKAGLPDEEKVPLVARALANSRKTATQRGVYVVVANVNGSSLITSGSLAIVQLAGVVLLNLSGATAGDTLYLSDLGKIELTAGTYGRRVGEVVSASGSTVYAAFSGHAPHGGEQISLETGGSTAVVASAQSDLFIMTEESGRTISLVTSGGSWRVGSDGTLQGEFKEVCRIADPTASTSAATKAYVDSAVQTAPSALFWGNATAASGAPESYVDPGFGARQAPLSTDSHPRLSIPFAGKLSNLYVNAVTGPVGGSVDFTVCVNEGTTALEARLGVGATTGSDTTHTVNVSAGDTVKIRMKTAGGTTGSPTDFTITLRLSVN